MAEGCSPSVDTCLYLTGTTVPPSSVSCPVPGSDFWNKDQVVQVLPYPLKITELTLNDIDNKKLEYLSTDDHTYFLRRRPASMALSLLRGLRQELSTVFYLAS